MQLSRFWASVWSVVAYLFGIGLLQYLAMEVKSLFGLLDMVAIGLGHPEIPGLLGQLVSVVVPVVGTLVFIDWRWGWQPEHIGLTRDPGSAAGWLAGGILAGAVAAILSLGAGAVFGGSAFSLALPQVSEIPWMQVVWTLLASFAVEMVFRGSAVSRYQSDLTQREVLMAAPLTPFGWMLIQRFFGMETLWSGVSTGWMAAMSIALTLLFLRTDSVWFSAGVRFGMVGWLLVTGANLEAAGKGGLVVWGVAAVVLLALEWFKQQGLPKRVQPSRGSRTFSNRTVRGPWGPH